MEPNDSFFNTVDSLAVPVALQSMLQSSFSIVDQIMIGQLGSVSVAAVGLAGRFAAIILGGNFSHRCCSRNHDCPVSGTEK